MDSVLAHSHTPQTSSFTCNSCGIRFAAADLQRVHMKTDWHRYNLKRRVAELPPVTSDNFAEKFALSQNNESAVNEDEYGFRIYNKISKGKGNSNELKKKDLQKHQKALMRGRNNLIIGMENGIDVTRDLSPVSVADSEFSHFSLAQSLAATDSDYETHSEGVAYTSDDDDLASLPATNTPGAGGDENAGSADEAMADEDYVIPITSCFYCGVDNVEVDQNVEHMFKSHGLFIPNKENLVDLPGLLEFLSEIISLGHECLYCGFFGKNLESVQQHMKAKSHCKMPFETKDDRELFNKFYAVEENSSEGEDVEISGDGTDLDNYTQEVGIDETGTELVLPNGSRLGHRSMARIWRQNVVLDLVPVKDGQKTIQAVDRRLNSGLTLREVDTIDKRAKQQEHKAQNLAERKMIHSRKQGLNFQKHFRDELLQ